MKQLVNIEKISVCYDGICVLKDVDLTISENDFIGVIGPNGGGKTTLLKAILGLVTPESGTIRFADRLNENGSSIGYLPQVNQFDTSFPVTVREVVRSGLSGRKRWFQRFTDEDSVKVEKIIQQLGIENIVKKPIGELSGGQMQRVFLARAIVSDPALLILDEPDTYVDNQFESELYDKLKELNERMAILLVSHDVGTISYYVKSIACVNRELNYHPSNIISSEQLAGYNCPIQMITHGDVPHTVLPNHTHKH